MLLFFGPNLMASIVPVFYDIRTHLFIKNHTIQMAPNAPGIIRTANVSLSTYNIHFQVKVKPLWIVCFYNYLLELQSCQHCWHCSSLSWAQWLESWIFLLKLEHIPCQSCLWSWLSFEFQWWLQFCFDPTKSMLQLAEKRRERGNAKLNWKKPWLEEWCWEISGKILASQHQQFQFQACQTHYPPLNVSCVTFVRRIMISCIVTRRLLVMARCSNALNDFSIVKGFWRLMLWQFFQGGR